MALYTYSGMLLTDGGELATDEACCCAEGFSCLGCEDMPNSITVEITGVVNPGTLANCDTTTGGTCDQCDNLNDTYILDFHETACFTCGYLIAVENMVCICPEGEQEDCDIPSEFACNLNTNRWVEVICVQITKFTGPDEIRIHLEITDLVGEGAVQAVFDQSLMGATDCKAGFTLTAADLTGDNGVCDLSGITITITLI